MKFKLLAERKFILCTKLNNKTELNIENGSTITGLSIVVDNLNEIIPYVESLTKENLSHAEIVNENDLVVGVIKNKYLDCFTGTQITNTTNYRVSFLLGDVLTLEERIALLEAENEALKASQKIQDGAITEVGAAVASVPTV